MRQVVRREEDMLNLGADLAAVLKGNEVIYLKGELGAGKTTLVRGILRGLGYQGRVTSPTFTLMNVYPVQPPVYHFDLYRMEGEDLTDLGWEDYLERSGLTLIEWPEIGAGELPDEALLIRIDLVDGDYERERMVSIEARGTRYIHLLEELTQNVHTGH